MGLKNIVQQALLFYLQVYTNEKLDELKGNKRFSSARSNYFQALEKDEQVEKVTFSSAKAIVEVPRVAYTKNIVSLHRICTVV